MLQHNIAGSEAPVSSKESRNTLGGLLRAYKKRRRRIHWPRLLAIVACLALWIIVPAMFWLAATSLRPDIALWGILTIIAIVIALLCLQAVDRRS